MSENEGAAATHLPAWAARSMFASSIFVSIGTDEFSFETLKYLIGQCQFSQAQQNVQ